MVGSIFFVSDNSGVLKAKCIGFLNKGNGRVGDIGVYSILGSGKSKFLKRGKVVHGVILKIRHFIFRSTGHRVKFNLNGIVLCKLTDSRNVEPFSNRILVSVSYEVKLKGFLKIASISRNLI